MRPSPSGALRRVGLRPLVRPTRSQAEVEWLPPYGDPEVTLLGELATYLLVGAVAALGVALLHRRRPED
ncbi:MAG: hypothetical protein ABEJ92_10860 [Halobacteriales archaeon]